MVELEKSESCVREEPQACLSAFLLLFTFYAFILASPMQIPHHDINIRQ